MKSKSALASLAVFSKEFNDYHRSPRPDLSIERSVKGIVAVAESILAKEQNSAQGKIETYAAMKAVAGLLENAYFYLFHQGLLGKVYSMHPDPTLLSGACRAYMCRIGRGYDEEYKALTEQALTLGGFPTLNDIGESFRNFSLENAPDPQMCKYLLINTFSNMDLFVTEEDGVPGAGRYFSFLLAKIIDSGDAAWVIKFIEENQEAIKEHSPLVFRRTDIAIPESFLDEYLIHLQYYALSHKLVAGLAQADEALFDRIICYPEMRELLVRGASSRAVYDLSAIPLDPKMTKKVVGMALMKALGADNYSSLPLRFVDIARLEGSYVRAGLTSASFHAALKKQVCYAPSIRLGNALLDGLDSTMASNGPDIRKIQSLAKSMDDEHGSDFIAISAFSSESLQQGLLDRLPALSAFGVCIGRDVYPMLGIERDALSIHDLLSICAVESSQVDSLVQEWSESGLFHADSTIRELAGLNKAQLNSFKKTVTDVYTESELRKIPWKDGRITDEYLSIDLGL